MAENGWTDAEPTTSHDNTRQRKQTGTADPNGKISSLVYDFLTLPNPYRHDPDIATEAQPNGYSVFANFSPAKNSNIMEYVVCCLRKHTDSDRPYTPDEFHRLFKNGTLLGRPPNENDPRLYSTDAELAVLSPTDPIYRLRKAFIFRQATRKHQTQQQDEKDLLNRFGKDQGTDQEYYKAYLAYLQADYFQALAPFFREWRLPVTELARERHTIITAKTGSGKSELMKLAMHSDITRKRRRGVILLEPHGELSESVAKLKENYGSDRLIFIDPTLNPGFSPVINPLDVEDKSTLGLDRATEQLVDVFRIVLAGNSSPFTPNMETILLACVSVLILKGNSTLFDLLDFMDDEKNAELVEFGVKNLVNPSHQYLFTHDFRGHGKSNQYATTKAAIKTKLYSLLSSNALFNFLVGKSTIDLKAAMDSGKIVVVRLPKHLGRRSIETIGRFFTATVQNVAFERSMIPEDKRKTVHMYIDECHRFVSPVIEELLADARKYKVYMTFSSQILGQDADSDLKKIISSCTNVKITGANDYKSLSAVSRETGLEVEKMQDLRIAEFYIKAEGIQNIKIKAPSFLREEASFMTAAQWEQTKEEQLAKYYCKIDPRVREKKLAEVGGINAGRKPGSPIEI